MTTAHAAIICAADEPYALPLGVMLESLAANADPARRIHAYLIDCGISGSSRARIDKLARSNLRLHWRPSKRSADLADPHWGHVSGATYERLLIDRYLPDDTFHALWLDCDLLVLEDVTTLFQLPLNGNTLLAVRDPFVQSVSSAFGVCKWRESGLRKYDPYFNAGVMLIDIRRWRSTGVSSRAMQYIRRYGQKVIFNDQEALNAVIGRNWAPLDDRWNYSANPFHARRQHSGGDEPAIVHFAGRIKPWEIPDLGSVQDKYFEFLDNTSWNGTRPRRSARNRLVSWYVGSRLRLLTYRLENWHLRLCHLLGI